MKRSEIKHKFYCEIKIYSTEAERILMDLKLISQYKELMPETKYLIKYLEALTKK